MQAEDGDQEEGRTEGDIGGVAGLTMRKEAFAEFPRSGEGVGEATVRTGREAGLVGAGRVSVVRWM